jgi:hypothetical protein
MSQSNFRVEAVNFFGVGFYLSEMVENPEGTGYVYGIRHLCSHTYCTRGEAVFYTFKHLNIFLSEHNMLRCL